MQSIKKIVLSRQVKICIAGILDIIQYSEVGEEEETNAASSPYV
jgi:hypothetical protein